MSVAFLGTFGRFIYFIEPPSIKNFPTPWAVFNRDESSSSENIFPIHHRPKIAIDLQIQGHFGMCNDDGILRRARAVEKQLNAHLKNDSGTYSLTRKVVSHHNQPNDAWVIYQGGVYDVTLFLESHPGGSSILEQHLGEDVTDVMHDGQNNHAHSSFAIKLLEKYKIGNVIDARGAPAIDGNVDAHSGGTLVQWDKPILHQVGMLGDRYQKWIHSFPTTDHSVKMFTNDTIEALTKCQWYIPLVFWIPIILVESAHYVALIDGVANLRLGLIAFMFAWGMIFWLFFEYSLHRWIFHWNSTSYFGNIVHFLIHGHHHITPMDTERVVFPPVPALILGSPFWYWIPRIMGVHGYPWLVGFVVGYLIYDMTHFWIHQAVPKNSFLKQQKRRHVHHHYFQPTVNFGISNPLFDYVFNTIKEPCL